ncbi:MAG: RAMP superfamily CRISPR-associated protein [Thermodesulfobacteriota bacterium]
MAKREAPKEGKPFFWVSLDKNRAPQKEKPPAHERFGPRVGDWNGRLELEVEVVSEYLYVGSGEFGLFNLNGKEQAYYVFARHNGRLVIPGTGIKGAVRSIVEAISNSCIRQSAKGKRAPGSYRACDDEHRLCPACRLFGTTGYRGRVHFSDAIPVGEVKTSKIKVADLWPPRQTRGRKFYQTKEFQPLDQRPEKSHRFLEVVPKGSRFSSSFYFENVSSAEMGLVMRALGLDLSPQDPSKAVRAFPVKLGGAKPRCLGAVYLHPGKLYLIPSGPGLFSALLSGGAQSPPEQIRQHLVTWLKDSALLDQEAWQVFLKEAKRKGELCPAEVY